MAEGGQGFKDPLHEVLGTEMIKSQTLDDLDLRSGSDDIERDPNGHKIGPIDEEQDIRKSNEEKFDIGSSGGKFSQQKVVFDSWITGNETLN